MHYRRVVQSVVVAALFALPAVVLAAPADSGGNKAQLKNQSQHEAQYEKQHRYQKQISAPTLNTDGVRLQTQERTTTRTRIRTGNTK